MALALVALGLLDPTFARGQAPAEEVFFETATVEARPIASAAASVTIIDRETIDRSGARSVDELLRDVAGLSILGDGSRGALNAAQIRGGDPNFSLILIDGVPVNDATDQVGGAFNLASLPVSGIERIEIVRGPISAVYGSTGLGGAVHIVTRRGSAAPRFEAELAGGDFDQRTASVGASGGHEETSWAFDLSWQEEAGRIGDDSFEGVNLYGRLGHAWGENRRLDLAVRFADWQGDDYPDGSGGPLRGDGALRTNDHDELSVSLGLGIDPDGPYRHRARLAVYRHQLDRESPAIFPLVPPATESTTFLRAQAGWSTTWQGPRWQASVGLDVDHEDGDNQSVLALPPFLGGDVVGDYQVTRTTGGAYVEVVGRIGAVNVELGARVDAPEGLSPEVSPRLGMSVRPRDGAYRWHASAGRAFKLPSFFATFSPRQLGGNPELAPETVTSAELGVERRVGDGHLGLTVFFNRYRDLVDFDFQQFLHLNRDRVESRGAELSLVLPLSATLDLAADVTYQDVEDEGGAALRHRPPWLASGRLRWRPHGDVDLILDLRHTDTQRDEQIPVPERTQVAAHELLGFGANWRWRPGWQIRLRLDNLLDETYETFIGYPGAGRSFRLGLRRTVR